MRLSRVFVNLCTWLQSLLLRKPLLEVSPGQRQGTFLTDKRRNTLELAVLRLLRSGIVVSLMVVQIRLP